MIQEFRARGRLTKALFAVVGFDDGLAILIFGMAAAAARAMLLREGMQAGATVGASLFASVLAAHACRAEKKIRKYLGLGILSQAGVAIALALTVQREFAGLGSAGHGDRIGTIVITTVTATSIVFEIVGPILTKYALRKAGEIPARS